MGGANSERSPLPHPGNRGRLGGLEREPEVLCREAARGFSSTPGRGPARRQSLDFDPVCLDHSGVGIKAAIDTHAVVLTQVAQEMVRPSRVMRAPRVSCTVQTSK